MAFQQGLSGLNTSSKALDVISNNISNASTVGFKAGQAMFADIFAASLGVGGASQVGIGANMISVQQQFSQGNISNSNNPLDIAVNGSGFFRLQKSPENQTISYTRNGQYHLDAQGYIVNASSFNLTGYQITEGVTDRTALIPVQLDTTGSAPRSTGYAVLEPGIKAQINMDDRDLKSLVTGGTSVLAPWSANGGTMPPTNLNTFNYSTSLTIYDQKGNDHALSMYFSRLGNPDEANGEAADLWQTHFVLDNKDITPYVQAAGSPFTTDPNPALNNGFYDVPTMQFGANGKVLQTPGVLSAITVTDEKFMYDAAGNTLNFLPDGSAITSITNLTDATRTPALTDITVTNGKIDYLGSSPVLPGDQLMVTYDTGADGMALGSSFQINVNYLETNFPEFNDLFVTTLSDTSGSPVIPLSFDNSTLFGSGYDVNKLVQDGYPYGRLSGVSVSAEGVLRGNYSNGQTKDIAQLVLVDFISPNGLLNLGNNQWAETASSGQPLVGDPGSGNRGVLQSAAVEDANIDLTEELVNLITHQRNYQANAQSIKTQDQVMQTIVNLR